MVVIMQVVVVADIDVKPKAKDNVIQKVATDWVEENLRDYLDVEVTAVGVPLE